MQIRGVSMGCAWLVWAVACGGGSPDGSTAARVSSMSVADARTTVSEFRMEYGDGEPVEDVAPPTDLAAAYGLVREDRFPAFDAALRFAEGQEGAEALALRAWVHTSRAGAFVLVRAILEERATRLASDARALERRADVDAGAAARAEELRGTVAAFQRASEAMAVLGQDSLSQGGELAEEAVRRYPRLRPGYVALASFHRLRGAWPDFDAAMRTAEGLGEPSAPMLLLRAFEALDRYRDRAAARALFQEASTLDPELVRAKAVLVFLEEDPAARHEALVSLREVAPRHPVVELAGPTLEAELAASADLAP